MAYQRGNSKQIIVGAAALFAVNGELIPQGGTESGSLVALEAFVPGEDFKETLTDNTTDYKNLGFTSNGLEMTFQPDFGEVQVDQLLDVAKLFKQGMQVNLNTTLAEATLDNLVLAIAADPSNLDNGELDLLSGELGEAPRERSLVAVGPGAQSTTPGDVVQRVYSAYRALSMESVTVSAKRDEASMFEVSFRLLPNDAGSYGKIIDRSYTPSNS